MTSEDVQTNLRLPAELKERVVKAAAQNKRSLSAEVAARLEESFQAKQLPQISASDMKELLDTNANAQRMFADQMYKAGAQLLKEDQALKETTLELLTAAMLLAEDRRNNPQATNTPLQQEEAIGLVQAAKSSSKKTKSSNSS